MSLYKFLSQMLIFIGLEGHCSCKQILSIKWIAQKTKWTEGKTCIYIDSIIMMINNNNNVFQRLSNIIVTQSALCRVYYNYMKLVLIHKFIWDKKLKLETFCLVGEFELLFKASCIYDASLFYIKDMYLYLLNKNNVPA